jgi:3-oxoacyl-[acyl-carrier protein] reductase
LNRRIIIITGANGGLGTAIARSFLQEANDNFVWLGVRSRRQRAEALAAEFGENRCQCVSLDVTNPGSWREAVTQVTELQGRIDVLVNNAGKHADALLGSMPETVWREVLSTNLDSAFHGCKAVLPFMIAQRGGRIINIASLSAILAPAGQTNYSAAKAGLVALTQSLAKEVARINITVNAVCPGFIETEALKDLNPEDRKTAISRVPMRRFGRPEEVAAAVRFLACAEAGYITGSVIKIDGGIF